MKFVQVCVFFILHVLERYCRSQIRKCACFRWIKKCTYVVVSHLKYNFEEHNKLFNLNEGDGRKAFSVHSCKNVAKILFLIVSERILKTIDKRITGL